MSQPTGQPKTLQIGVVLPPLDQYREGNLKDRLAASLPLFLDHHDIPGISAVDLAIAHPHRGTAFCLVEAPTRAAWNQCTCKASAETAVRHQPRLGKSISRTRFVVPQPKSHKQSGAGVQLRLMLDEADSVDP